MKILILILISIVIVGFWKISISIRVVSIGFGISNTLTWPRRGAPWERGRWGASSGLSLQCQRSPDNGINMESIWNQYGINMASICFSSVNIHLMASICWWTVGWFYLYQSLNLDFDTYTSAVVKIAKANFKIGWNSNRLVDMVGFTFTTAPSSLKTLWEK